MRGFLLTLDALFAISLLSLTAWFFVYASAFGAPVTDWAVTAADQAQVGFDPGAFSRISGLKTANAPPNGSPAFAHGAAYKYPVLCQGVRPASDPCFSKNDATAAASRTEAWVGP